MNPHRREVEPEDRSWPRENAKNTKKAVLDMRGEGRSDFFLLKLLLRSAPCVLCVLLRRCNFGIRVEPKATPMVREQAKGTKKEIPGLGLLRFRFLL
jgi:hypothetical protein